MTTPALDLAFAVFFTIIITAFDTLYFVPKFKAAVNAGVPDARLHAYRRTVLGQWGFAAAAIFLWMRSGRSWSELGVVPPTDGRMIATLLWELITGAGLDGLCFFDATGGAAYLLIPGATAYSMTTP